jgi:hypothetical protein
MLLAHFHQPGCPMPPRVLVLVRVPKSGSTTLVHMVTAALPDARIYRLPHMLRSDEGPSRLEKLRRTRSRMRRFFKLFGTVREKTALQRLAAQLRDGDIVSGHFAYGTLDLPDFQTDCVTLLRHPLDRLISEYNYTRVGFEQRWRVQRLYHRGRLAAARLSFADYLAFLEDNRTLFENLATRYVTGARTCADPAFLQQNYFHFGALERLDRFAEGLSAKLGVEVQPRHERITSQRADIAMTARDQARFERLFAEDLNMYDQVLSLIDRGAA